MPVDVSALKKAWRKQVGKWYPDVYSGDLSIEEITDRTQKINSSYKFLQERFFTYTAPQKRSGTNQRPKSSNTQKKTKNP